jgi:tRNA 2-selenouridine synthase
VAEGSIEGYGLGKGLDMANKISIHQYWKDDGKPVLLDVRTPAEYAKGHIPGACNLPLFTNEERAKVGTTYKKEGAEKALLQGLDFVGPKMSRYIRQAQELAPARKVTVHCWRGGKRSFSMAWLLGIAGFEVQTLEGGYKAYRQEVLSGFEQMKAEIVVLGGKTGCGKTLILQELGKQGEQILDLEALANHKGSAFGWVGEATQPTVEQFENELFDLWRRLDMHKRLWIENESRSIGSVFLPQAFWNQLKAAPLINISLPLSERVAILVDMYGQFDRSLLVASFEKIKKRLGGQHHQAALAFLEAGDLAGAAEIALAYYDKSYEKLLSENKAPRIVRMDFEGKTAAEIAEYLRKVAI